MSAWALVRAEIERLMCENAEAVDALERAHRSAHMDRDRWVAALLDIIDTLHTASQRLRDPEAQDALDAISTKALLEIQRTGLTVLHFERGEQPPLGEMEVIGMVADDELPSLSVVRTVRRGLRDHDRVIRKAGVEISQRTAGASEGP